MRGALIGCGFFAQNHLNAWRDMREDGVELVAVCDIDPAKAKAAAEGFGIPHHYTDPADPFVAAVHQIVLVLHRRHGKVSPGSLDVLDRHRAQPKVVDEPLALHIGESTELLVARHFGIDTVELPKGKPVQPQPAKAHQHGLPEVFWPPERGPAVGALPALPGLGSHDDVVIRVEGLADEFFADGRAIGISGVDQVDAEVSDPAQRGEDCTAIRGRSPYAWAGGPHRAIPQPIDRDVAALNCPAACAEIEKPIRTSSRSGALNLGSAVIESLDQLGCDQGLGAAHQAGLVPIKVVDEGLGNLRPCELQGVMVGR